MASRPNIRSRRVWLIAALTVAGVVLFVWQQDFSAMQGALKSANPLLVLAAAAAYLAAHAVRAVRWRYLLQHLHDCGRWKPFHALTIGVMTNNLLPVKAGVVARAHLLTSRTRLSGAAVGSSMIVEGIFDGIIMLGLVVVALALVELDTAIRASAIVIASGMGVALLLLALLLRGHMPKRLISIVMRRCPPKLETGLRETGTHIVAGMGAMRHPRQASSVLITSIAGWVLMGVAYVLLGFAFGLSLSIIDYVVILAVAQFLLGGPPVGGNIGGFHVVTAQTLVAVGATPGEAGAYVVALYALIVVPVTMLGLILLWADHTERRPSVRMPSMPALPAMPSAPSVRQAMSAPTRLIVRPQLRIVGGRAARAVHLHARRRAA